MTLTTGIVLGILVTSFALFITGWLKPDVIAMMVLVSLVLSRVIDPDQAFAGFSSFAVITIAGLMVIGDGLERTGVVKWVARRLEKIIHKKYNRLLLVNTAIPGLLSGFVNIVAAASFFIPVILRLSKQLKVAQSKILLPMACAALIGANLSLIGASHNLVVNSLLEQAEGVSFGFFEFTAMAAALLVVALIYIFTLGSKLLPGEQVAPEPEEVPVTADLIDVYELEDRLFEVWVSEDPEGLTVEDLELEKRHGLILLAVVRESEQLLFPETNLPLEQGDMLLLQGREGVVESFAEDREDMTFLGPPKGQEEYPLSTAELAEAVVPPRSPAIGKSLRDLRLVEEFGMTALAYYRDGRPHRTGAQEVELQDGDSILVYGPREKMREFDPEKELLIYFKPGEPEVPSHLKTRAPLAAAILILVILVAAVDWFPIAVTALAGAVLMVLAGIVPLGRVYQAVDWRTLILIGGMYPLGVALNQSGAADLIGETLVAGLGGFGPVAVLGGIVVLCMVLTQPMHNAAVAIIVTPIAIQAASLTGSNPKAFCVGVIVACSTAFLMPYGHPVPLMVQKPGGYSGGDYVRFGLSLNLLALGVILVLVPLLWSL